MWLFAFICFSYSSVDLYAKPPRDPEEIQCQHDVECGEGDCWIGACEYGVCVGYHKCV